MHYYSCWSLIRLCRHVLSAQRSAQELPAVERQDLDQCSALGGQQMVLTGQNFTPGSKVIFSEKTQGEIRLFGTGRFDCFNSHILYYSYACIVN